MKSQIFAGIILLAASVSSTAFAVEVGLRDVNGNEVVITEAEVRRGMHLVNVANKNLRTDRVSRIDFNDDGSVTFVSPRYLYNGQLVPFVSEEINLRNLCRFLGLPRYVVHDAREAPDGMTGVMINADGGIHQVIAPRGSSYYGYFLSITCR